ncbi:MAG TPA: hypothetical protein VK888_04730 [Anaerolineales bacterium]|nr:hypothetical protein [Anaerolineales bacterium]
MNEMDFETQVQAIAGGMEYPPTPDIAGAVSTRLRTSNQPRLANQTWTRTLVFALVLLASLMLIPPVRAAVIEFIEIGIVRIFRADPAPLPGEIPATQFPLTATSSPTLPALIPFLEELAGETTLAEAQAATGDPILLPGSPADLGEPDRVFIQDADGPMTILVWIDSGQPTRVRMSLHLIPEGSWAITKMGPDVVQETQVAGQYAVWAQGPYPIHLDNGDLQFRRMITGHVLIWEEGEITYRLETDASLEEAIRIAESLEPAR